LPGTSRKKYAVKVLVVPGVWRYLPSHPSVLLAWLRSTPSCHWFAAGDVEYGVRALRAAASFSAEKRFVRAKRLSAVGEPSSLRWRCGQGNGCPFPAQLSDNRDSGRTIELCFTPEKEEGDHMA
jgi:hypothetical protein